MQTFWGTCVHMSLQTSVHCTSTLTSPLPVESLFITRGMALTKPSASAAGTQHKQVQQGSDRSARWAVGLLPSVVVPALRVQVTGMLPECCGAVQARPKLFHACGYTHVPAARKGAASRTIIAPACRADNSSRREHQASDRPARDRSGQLHACSVV